MKREKILHLPCTIRIRHDWESLEAHVELGNNMQPEIGDRVTVHGAAVQVPFGESITIHRDATVRRAGPLERAWIRFQAMFELKELYEVSFSEGMMK